MKKWVLLVAASVLVLSLMGIVCSIANCRILYGMPEDFIDLPDGRVFLEGEPPYPYIPTETPRGPIRTPFAPVSPKELP